jgi:hypothetical protein
MVIHIDEIIYTSKFEHEVRRIWHKGIKDKIEKNIKKIIENPKIGKPLSYAWKEKRTIEYNHSG